MPTPEIIEVLISQITPGDNDRTVFRAEELETLAASIAQDGLVQPITVRPVGGGYQIVAGERRFRAIRDVLRWRTVPAIIRRLTDEQASAVMLVENVHRVDINPLDEARAYDKRMKQFSWSLSEIARKANVSTKRVSARLSLLQLVPEAQKLIQDGQLGTQFGEAMSPLDHNRQRIAMQYLVTTERPLLREFRAIVGKLLAEQAQDSLFDTQAFILQAIDEHTAARAERYTRRFPTDERLPLMKREGTVGLSFERYIAELMASDDKRLKTAAPIVGRIYEAMLANGFAYPPKSSSPIQSEVRSA